MKGGSGDAGTTQKERGMKEAGNQKPLRLNTIVPCAEMITRGNTMSGQISDRKNLQFLHDLAFRVLR